MYQEPVSVIFHEIKYRKKPWLLNIFAQALQTFSMSPEMNHYDLVVPIPLDVKRERERGFNQALLIARLLQRFRRQHLVVTGLLTKKKMTAPQSRLPRAARLENLRGAFSVKKPDRVRDQHILLVDDVITTGSTVNECAKILKHEGARRVDFLALARSNTS